MGRWQSLFVWVAIFIKVSKLLCWMVIPCQLRSLREVPTEQEQFRVPHTFYSWLEVSLACMWHVVRTMVDCLLKTVNEVFISWSSNRVERTFFFESCGTDYLNILCEEFLRQFYKKYLSGGAIYMYLWKFSFNCWAWTCCRLALEFCFHGSVSSTCNFGIFSKIALLMSQILN